MLYIINYSIESGTINNLPIINVYSILNSKYLHYAGKINAKKKSARSEQIFS
jgi:hypothetical protein